MLGQVLRAVRPGKSTASNDDGIVTSFGWSDFSHSFVLLRNSSQRYRRRPSRPQCTPVNGLERIAERKFRTKGINRIIGNGIGKPRVGDMLVFNAETHIEIIRNVVLRTGTDHEGEVKVLAQTTLSWIRISKDKDR